MRKLDLSAPIVLKFAPLIADISKALDHQDEAKHKLDKKLERERWRKDHPQWRLADLDRVSEWPGPDGDDATHARYNAALRAHDMWSMHGTPMTEAVLGPPTRKGVES